MASLTLLSAPMKARFSSFNLALESVVPAPGSGVRVGNGLPMPKTGAQLANQPQTVASISSNRPIAGNRPSVGGLAAPSAPPPPPTGTPMQCPPALFRAASNHKIDCEFQQSMHDELNKFFDAITQGLIQGMNFWKMQANFTDVKIMGPLAMGGRIQAPHIDSQIMAATTAAFGGPMSGWTYGLLEGVARGFSNKWKELGDNARVPGLPWYPQFAAMPMPYAPPTANNPTPFMTLALQRWCVDASVLKAEMMRKAPAGTPHADTVLTVVSDQLSAALALWMTSQQIMLAMGKGPCPAYAPPYVPVSPVVGGEITSESRPFMT